MRMCRALTGKGKSMQSFEVTVLAENQSYTGHEKVEGKTLTVVSHKYGRKSARVSANNESLAQLLLLELVNASKVKGWSDLST